MDLFTDFELLIMGSILAGLLFIIFILVISEIISNRKDKKVNIEVEEVNKEENNNINEEVSIEQNINIEELTDKVEINKEEIQVSKEEIIINDTLKEDDFIEELDLTVVKIENEVDSLLDAREKAQIELLKVEEELQNEPSLEDTITNLEIIEEENAIISYQELLSNTGKLDVVNCDEGNEPITISEVFKMFNDEEDNYMTNNLDNESLTEIQLENTANLEKLDKEIRKTNEFLNILNELKKNLE